MSSEDGSAPTTALAEATADAPASLEAVVGTGGGEHFSDGETYLSGDEDFDALQDGVKGAVSAPAGDRLVVEAAGDGGSGGGGEKDGVLVGEAVGGGSETLISEGGVGSGKDGLEGVGFMDSGATEAKSSVVDGEGPGYAGASGEVQGEATEKEVVLVPETGGGDGAVKGEEKKGDVSGGIEVAKVSSEEEISAVEGSVPGDSDASAKVPGETVDKDGLEGVGVMDSGAMEAKSTVLDGEGPGNAGASGEVQGEATEKEVVLVPETRGSDEAVKGEEKKGDVSSGIEVAKVSSEEEISAVPGDSDASAEVLGETVDKEVVVVSEAGGGDDGVKGKEESGGADVSNVLGVELENGDASGGGKVGDAVKIEEEIRYAVGDAGVVPESPLQGAESIKLEKDSDLLVESGSVDAGEGSFGKVEALVEPGQVPLGAVSVNGDQSVEKEVEPLGLEVQDSEAPLIEDGVVEEEVGLEKVDGEVGMDSNASIGDEEGDANKMVPELQEREIAVDGTVNSVSDSSQVIMLDEPEEDDEKDDDREVLNSEESSRVVVLDSSEAVKQLLKELVGEGSSAAVGSDADGGSSLDFSQEIDAQIATDSDEETYTDEEGGEKEIFDSAALAALLRAATGATSDSDATISAPEGSRVFSIDRPAGLGSSMPSLRPGPARTVRQVPPTSSYATVTAEPEGNMSEEERALHEKVDQIRVKFLRIVHRLGHSSEDTVAAQVLYRLGLAEGIKHGRQTSRAFSTDSAKRKALHLEESGEQPLEFSCNILVLGKTGVGKSSIINSVLGNSFAPTDAFKPTTIDVREITGVVDGVNIRFLDTPGLRPSVMDQGFNKKILSSIKKHTEKCPPDIVLYVDRLDIQTRDFNDLPLLRSISSVLGSSIWFNAIVALTHAASAPPDGPNGTPLGYEVFVAQRSMVVQHSIRQAAGDMRLMNPVAYVENHPSCRRNREGQRVLPNGAAWKPQLLLLCYSSKTLSEANSLLKLQESTPGKLFGFRMRSPPLPYLLSSLLQSRAHPKLPSDMGGEIGDSDVELEDLDFDEDENYDRLPPFRSLRKAELAKLSEEQRKSYYDEFDYRLKLLQKKQLQDEARRVKEMKRKMKKNKNAKAKKRNDYDDSAVPVPLPDMVLPPSFDCNIPSYRYRFLEPTSQLLARPVLDTHGWDHDCGYDGVSLENNLAILEQFPASFALQVTKDKKEFNIHLDSSVAAKHGENGSSLAGFDIQNVGRQLAYIVRGETKFKIQNKNKGAAGVSVTFLGENVVTGLKVEDQVVVRKRLCLVGSTGAVRSQGDTAYGANLEARLRPKDYPIDQEVCTLGLSLMKWRRDLALGGNFQTQVSVGRNSKMAVRVGLNNKLTGQFTIRTSTSDQLQIALVAVIPIAMSIYHTIWPSESY